MRKGLEIGIVCLMLTAVLAGCSGKTGTVSSGSSDTSNGQTSDTGSSSPSSDLKEMMSAICKGADIPPSDIFPVSRADFEGYAFVPWETGMEAVCSEGQITTAAHSLVLIRTGDTDTKTLAENIAGHADMRKWVCVEAEAGKVLYTDHYVLLIMTNQSAVDTITDNFGTLAGSAGVRSLDIKKA
jgi:hypothetical protein